MSRQDYVAKLIGELAESIGLRGAGLDADGRLGLRVGGIPLFLRYTAGPPVELLWLSAQLGEIPPADREALQGCLSLGFFTWIANRMTLALSEDGRVSGHTAIPVVNLDLQTLRAVLAGFAQTGQILGERIARRDFDVGAGGAGPADWLAGGRVRV